MDSLACTLFDLTPAGAMLLRPHYDAQQQVVDFAFEQLNLAGQHLLRLPAQPAQTLLQLYPEAAQSGVFAFYRDVFLAGETDFYGVDYRVDNLEAYYQLAARRAGEYLVVSFTDTADRRPGNVETALRRSHQAEQQARADADAQRQRAEQLSLELETRVATRTQQLEAQAVAERERTQLQALFTQAPVAIALFRGPEVRVVSANERMAALWGRTPAQVVGRTLLEAVPELQGQGFDDLIRQVHATGVPYIGTEAPALIVQDGKPVVRYYTFSIQPIYDALGELLGVLNVGTEVTEQVEARRHIEQLNQELEVRVATRTRELSEQRELLGQILGQVPAFIATLSGAEHRYSFFNEPYQALAAGRAVLHHTVAEVFPEVVAQGFVGLLDQVYATGEPFVGVDTPAQLYDARTGRNEQRYVDFVYQPLLDAQQRVQGILAFVVDVTERILARQQAEALQAELLAAAQRRAQERQDVLRVFAHAPLAVALLREPNHQLDYWNARFDEFFPGAQRGVSVAKALPSLATQEVLARLDHLYQGGQTYQSSAVELPGRAPEDAPRYVIFTYQAYREAERIAGVALFLQDVTEQVRGRQQVDALNQELAAINEKLTATNQELHESNTQLTRTNADLDTFVYAASHDLKSPIANIEGLLNALREYLPTEQQQPVVARLVGMMEGAIGRFQQTVGHLTDIAHVQREALQPAEALDLPALLDGVRLDLLPLLESTQAELVTELDECPDLRFSAKSLRSVLFNLLSNAVKYRVPGRPPLVHVRARCSAAQLVLEVQDNGLGLSETQQAKLFTMFKRLHAHVEGSGVGLYLIKRLIENAGGTIAVRSEPGVGSTFTVTLPRA